MRISDWSSDVCSSYLDIISAVPQSLREGAYGLGSTQSETIKQVILPAALPGVVGAVLLAASRAIGETMLVVLAAGVAANKIGRASCRERVCHYGYVQVVAGSIKKQTANNKRTR